jgi:hypothetical protein
MDTSCYLAIPCCSTTYAPYDICLLTLLTYELSNAFLSSLRYDIYPKIESIILRNPNISNYPCMMMMMHLSKMHHLDVFCIYLRRVTFHAFPFSSMKVYKGMSFTAIKTVTFMQFIPAASCTKR